jgi:hypothetical protein
MEKERGRCFVSEDKAVRSSPFSERSKGESNHPPKILMGARD